MKKDLKSVLGDVRKGTVVRLHLEDLDGETTNYVGQVSQINSKYVAVGSFKGSEDHLVFFDDPRVGQFIVTGYTKFTINRKKPIPKYQRTYVDAVFHDWSKEKVPFGSPTNPFNRNP